MVHKSAPPESGTSPGGLLSYVNSKPRLVATVVCRLATDSQSPQIWTNSFNQHALGTLLKRYIVGYRLDIPIQPFINHVRILVYLEFLTK